MAAPGPFADNRAITPESVPSSFEGVLSQESLAPAAIVSFVLVLLVAAVATRLFHDVGFSWRPRKVGPLTTSGAHSWQPCDVTVTTRPLFCNECHSILSGITHRVFTCEVCELYAHDSCLASVSRRSRCKALIAPTASEKAGGDTAAAAAASTTTAPVELASGAGKAGGSGEPGSQAAESPASDPSPAGAVSAAGAGSLVHSGVTTAATEAGPTPPLPLQHHWVEGNLLPGARCGSCDKVCASAIGLSGRHCVWCRVAAHDDCVEYLSAECDRGILKRMVLPPSAFSRVRPPEATPPVVDDPDPVIAGAAADDGDAAASESAVTSEASDAALMSARTGVRTTERTGGAASRTNARNDGKRGDPPVATKGGVEQSLSQRLKRRVTRAYDSVKDGLRRRRRAKQSQQRRQAEEVKFKNAPPFWCHPANVPVDVIPTVVLVNRDAGGRAGAKILAVMRRLLHPLQVGDLGLGGPAPALRPFTYCKRLRVLACGGDGTVGWVLSALPELHLACTPAVAVLPLGTGNDLAQVLRWGPGFTGLVTEAALTHRLWDVQKARLAHLDRWSVRVRDFSKRELGNVVAVDARRAAATAAAGDGDVGLASADGDANGNGQCRNLRKRLKHGQHGSSGGSAGSDRRSRNLPDGVPSIARPFAVQKSPPSAQALAATRSFSMVNYFGIGVGARVALEFHQLRQRHPKLFCSRLCNKFWYSQVGGLEILRRSCRHLPTVLRLECDGRPIPLPEGTQGVIVLNINSYGGGADLWGQARRRSVHARRSPTGASGGALSVKESGRGGGGGGASSAGPSPDDHGVSSSPAYDDGRLEVVAVMSSFHLAQMQVGLSTARRLAQCRRLRIWTSERLPMQVDGEPHEQPPGVIECDHLDRAAVLRRSETEASRAVATMESVLQWGVASEVIDSSQHERLASHLRDVVRDEEGVVVPRGAP